MTNRVLLDGSVLMDRLRASEIRKGRWPLIAVMEQSTGLTYRGMSSSQEGLFTRRAYRLAASYVSGLYTIKVGFNGGQMKSRRTDYLVGEPITYRFRNGVPNRLTLLAVPHVQKADISQDTGLFAQDRWTCLAADAAGRGPVRLLQDELPGDDTSSDAVHAQPHADVPRDGGTELEGHLAADRTRL